MIKVAKYLKVISRYVILSSRYSKLDSLIKTFRIYYLYTYKNNKIIKKEKLFPLC